MHEFGYSHGDLKPENICARESHDGTWKFTLIDLGMSSKLPRLGEDTTRKSFRGNYIFASTDQIINKRPTQLDDIYSLLCVAYMFIYKATPWVKYLEHKSKKEPGVNWYEM